MGSPASVPVSTYSLHADPDRYPRTTHSTGIGAAREANDWPTDNPPAATLLGIHSLFSSMARFEYEGIAVVDP